MTEYAPTGTGNARLADWCGGCAWLTIVLYFAAALLALTGAEYYSPRITIFSWVDCIWMGMFMFYVVLLSTSDAISGKYFIWPFVIAILLAIARHYWTLGYTANPVIAFFEVLFVAVVGVSVFHLQRHFTAILVGTTSKRIAISALISLSAITLLSLPGISARVQRELNTPKIIQTTPLMYATLNDFIVDEHITNYPIHGETNPLTPSVNRIDDNNNLAITFSAGAPPIVTQWAYAGIARPIVVRDESGFGIIAGDNCMGPLSAIKYSYNGLELWRYEPPESCHPHGVGILSPRRRIVVLWDFDPQLEPGRIDVYGPLLHIVSWDTGRRISWVRVPGGAKGLAIDDEEKYLYLLQGRTDAYSITRVALDDCYAGGGNDR